MKEQVTLDETISFLNELIRLDPNAMAALIANRVPINEEMSQHPTVVCFKQHGGYHTGLLNIINGLFGIYEGADGHVYGPIDFVFENGDLIRVERAVA